MLRSGLMRADLGCYSYSCGGKSFSYLGFTIHIVSCPSSGRDWHIWYCGRTESSQPVLAAGKGVNVTLGVLWDASLGDACCTAVYGRGGRRALVSMHGMVLYWVG